MKLLYLSLAGHAYAEDVPSTARMIEADDGMHPVTAGSVWRDTEHSNDAIMLTQHGISAPEGDKEVRKTVIETERLKLHLGGIGASRRWFRKLISIVIGIFYAATIVFMIVGVYITIWLIVLGATGVVLPI